jgi:SAM-dependent methyltransferase
MALMGPLETIGPQKRRVDGGRAHCAEVESLALKKHNVSAVDFYDRMAPFYHLLFPQGFESSIKRHAELLDAIIRKHWGDDANCVLDVSCGIGTQALGLAQLGYRVTASDLSPRAVERATREAEKRGLTINLSVADMRQAFGHHGRQFDVVLSADNSVPHLLSDDEILRAFEQLFQCCRPGGGCLVSVRDYEKEDLTNGRVIPYGLRVEDGVRYLIFQVWEFDGQIYEISMYFVQDDGDSEPRTHVMRTQYYAIGAGKLMDLMSKAGFEDVQKLDDAYFQPVIVGTREKG